MKDIQGMMRGKCNKCECQEYTVSEGRVRCDYCDHTPGEHVRIIKLGECLSPQCAGGNCKEYMPEKETEYSNCLYCDCPATDHKGADELRKPKHAAGSDASSKASSASFGYNPSTSPTCNFPGCQYPKRVEGYRVHDFCSRTCAQKYQALVQNFSAGAIQMGGLSAAAPIASMGGVPQATPTPPPTAKPANICSAPGCSKPKHQGHEFCGKTCAQKGQGQQGPQASTAPPTTMYSSTSGQSATTQPASGLPSQQAPPYIPVIPSTSVTSGMPPKAPGT